MLQQTYTTEALLGTSVGIYYTPGSLKAKLCIDGRHRLYEYCDSHSVPYSKLGKLLVAAHDDQIPKLEGFLANGKKNGMTDLEWLDGPAARELEPDLHCVAAIRSPSTGVISSHKLACSPLVLHCLTEHMSRLRQHFLCDANDSVPARFEGLTPASCLHDGYILVWR